MSREPPVRHRETTLDHSSHIPPVLPDADVAARVRLGIGCLSREIIQRYDVVVEVVIDLADDERVEGKLSLRPQNPEDILLVRQPPRFWISIPLQRARTRGHA